jgi:serine/threonine-protein kinase
MSVRCQRCGTTFVEDISYCGRCGERLPPPESAGTERDPLIGHIVDGRYRVLSKLGEGGMGAVYKVEHVHMGKYMAMKLLLREFSGNRELVRRFRREAQAVSRLSHVNTVQVFDFGRTADGAMYMVMEYIQGENLSAVLSREGPMPPRRVVRIVGQICASLGEAHALGIVHRDLKPENVMLARARDQRDFVKVLDFGLAKLRERDEGATSHGSLVGTPYYMSPEQIRGADVDHRCDIYSLGAMMFKMLSGEPPFKAPSPIAVLTRHLQDPPPHLREVRPDLQVPPALEGVILKAMAKRREDRQQTVDELKRAVEAAVVEPGGAPPATPVPSGMLSFEDEAPEWSWATELNIGNRRDFDRFETRMRRRRLVRALVLLTLLGGAAAALSWGYLEGGWFERTSESEPNNQRREANAIPLGRRVKGFIGKRMSDEVGDVDWYRIRHPGGGPHVLRVEVTGIPNIDLVVEGFLGKESKRADWESNETGVGGREVIPNLRFERDVYVRVREAPMPGKTPTENVSDPYTIAASSRPARPNEELEPNDDLFTATDAALGTPVSGLHGRKGDRDYFRFQRSGQKGEVYQVDFKPVAGVPAEIEAIAGGFRLADKLPGAVTLPEGDKLLYVVVRTQGKVNLDRPYELRVQRVK